MQNIEALSVLRIIHKTTLAYGKNEVGLPGIDSRVLSRHPTIVLEGRLANCLQNLEENQLISRVTTYSYGITELGRRYLEVEASDKQGSVS